MSLFFQKLLITTGVLSCGGSAVAAIALRQDVRACAFALLGLVFVQAAAAIAVTWDSTDEAKN